MNNPIKNIKWKILVSTCLLWLQTRYDWKSKPQDNLIKILKERDFMFYCPEQGWWLPTPRIPAEIEPGKTAKDIIEWNAKILNKNWEDVTEQYLKWAYDMLELCKKFNISIVILKSKSPSCWYWKVYDWTFSWKLISWNWITAELLEQNWIKIFLETDFI